jgi:ribonucleoside-triphosphate reductase (thioredoxin)
MAIIKKIVETYDVYDITVEDNHNFYANDILVHNCVEIGMYPQYNGESGWQGCNLTEINGAKAINEEEFYKACRVGAILGTLQAGYTDFKFLTETTRKIFEREALLGVSITGWMNNPQVLLNERILEKGAKLVREVNRAVAKLIGINPAARTTCVKPAGNASVLLQTASGIHGEHSPVYIRNVQMNKDSEVAQLIKRINPYMVEESVWSANKTDYVVSFPVIAPSNSIWREDLYGVNLLEKVKLVQNTWVEYGTDESLCVDPTVRHNVSNTVSVLPDQWEEVEKYVFENRNSFAGISFLAASGDKAFNQAPNTEILDEKQIIDRYGRGAMFASGLIVDSTTGFDNLWDAILIAKQDGDFGDKEKADTRADWIRRFRKYAENYFEGDQDKADHCLKSVYLLHKWTKIQENYTAIDFTAELESKKFTDIDTMGAAACAGPIGCAI